MSKTTLQLTETTSMTTNDVVAMVDVSANQDKKMKKANFDNSKPYGELYSASGGTMTVAVINTWYLPTNGAGLTTDAGLLNEFTHDSATGKLTYTGTEDILVSIDCIAGLLSDGGNDDAKGAIFVNDSIITKSTQVCYADATEHNNQKLQCLVVLSKDDYVQTKWQNNTNTDNLTFATLHYKVTQI